MKVQQQQAKDKESAAAVAVSGTPPVGQRSITTRVDCRIVRSPNHQSKEATNGNGCINLHQRSFSPAHRVVRKHVEKKWKCDRCSIKYVVEFDWKAHMKI